MAKGRPEAGDKSSEESHELFERSTSTLFEPKAGRSPAPRFSRRLFIVHALHGLMLCINFSILVVSFRHWEHRLGVRLENIGNVNSYIAVSFQTFFTAGILTLYLLSSASAVDMAIRHPTTLTDLDFRLQAWTGLGSSLSNIFFQLGKFKTIHKSITIGIPLYFISGEVLKITSSSVVSQRIMTVR
ncbi:hypothetical protein BDZ89DRAFT_90401 [Hymenopellis radicata]|nr:hypothetical protein BDZ89DRAFT_90401 [Hymenopellis radicata]